MQPAFADSISEKEEEEHFLKMYITDDMREFFTLHTYLTTIGRCIFVDL